MFACQPVVRSMQVNDSGIFFRSLDHAIYLIGIQLSIMQNLMVFHTCCLCLQYQRSATCPSLNLLEWFQQYHFLAFWPSLSPSCATIIGPEGSCATIIGPEGSGVSETEVFNQQIAKHLDWRSSFCTHCSRIMIALPPSTQKDWMVILYLFFIKYSNLSLTSS